MTPYAGLVTRLGALAVDSVLLAIAVPVLANGPASVWAALAGQAPGWLKLGAQIVAALLPAAYFAVCWWGSGQTAGGVLFGTVVCRHGGRRLGFGRALARSVIGLLLPVVWLIGLLAILVDRERRALHDRLFGTVVLRKLAREKVRRVPPPASRVAARAK
jgi:uncharacterized RDD family membrane protein YckC